MIKYKLLNKNLTSYLNYQWIVGEKRTIDTPGNRLCSNNVFHFYDSPEIAILFNPFHCNIENPVLYSVEIGEVVAHDGIKGGTKEMTLLEPLPLPKISLEKRVEFAIRTAMQVYKASNFTLWAENWLSGKNRNSNAATDTAAAAAADAASFAANAATDTAAAAAAAADAASFAANAAADAADAAVADAAAFAATNAAYAADAAVADAAAFAATNAAYAAAAAAAAAYAAVAEENATQIINNALLYITEAKN